MAIFFLLLQLAVILEVEEEKTAIHKQVAIAAVVAIMNHLVIIIVWTF
ncbi:18918_t:CDS:2 [Entrophospora sp. SA101]|nr:18918_t:CDS:2 [Entrophospora sp. SA101]